MKKQMTKKITSILIMLIMLITLFPTRVTVQADDELATVSTGKYNDYEYRVNDKNEVIITKYSGTETDVVTPKVIDNKPVVGIGVNAFVCLCNLQTLTISEGVRFFEGILTDEDDNLKQINLPSTLSIGKISGSFITGCNGISGYCPALEDIFIAPGNPYLCKENGIIYDKNKTMVICSTPKTQLGSVVLPDTVNYIDDMAFNYNDTLTSIQIPDKVTYIGYWAFNNCTNLQYVNIPRSVKMIGQYAFHQTRIQSLYIPKEVGNVGIKGDVFSPCMGDGIKNIIVENGNPYFKVVDGALIYNNRIQLYASGNEQTSYTMPDYVTGIAWMAFCGAYNLKYISLSKRLEEIPYGAFDNCIHLKKIIIPEGIKKIDNNAFWNCYDLQKIGLPQSLTQIGNDVFANVYGKMDIYYPGSQSKWNSLFPENGFDIVTAIHSSTPAIHDKLTGVSGSLLETLAGLDHLVEEEIPVTIKHIFNRLSHPTLVETFQYLEEHYPPQVGFQFCTMDYSGRAGKNIKELFVTMEDIREPVEKMLDYLEMRMVKKRNISFIETPFCLTDPYYWKYFNNASNGLDTYIAPNTDERQVDYEVSSECGPFYEPCEKCAVKQWCAGTWRTAYKYRPTGLLKPICNMQNE